MFFLIGMVIMFGSVIGGYMAMGGKFMVLIQPFELVIIGGAAIGAFVIANPMPVIKSTAGAFGQILKGDRYSKERYLELLAMLYSVFKLAKGKGMLALEAHVEKPDESTLWQKFPGFHADHHAVEFFTDYLRLLTLGSDNPHEMEALIDEELETHHQEKNQVVSALQGMSDGLPALGIVAAVLGVIKTMAAISEPPEVLGHLIGAALVGTFLGVLLSYGLVGPMATSLKQIYDAEAKYFQCMKAGILAYMQGYAPAVAVEFARKALLSNVRPSFYEVEESVAALPPM
jgi:chemotaxis protein MotA